MEKSLLNNIEDIFVQRLKARLNPIQKLMSYYKCAIMEVETKFNVLKEEFSLIYERNPIDTIKTRVKTMDSIRLKIKKMQIPRTLEALEKNIFDIAGIRIICPFINDIYELSECLLKQDDITLIQRKDYIEAPKENGYRSLHLIVEIPIFLHNEKRLMKVEIQMRTIAMDFWASLEHQIRYKKDLSIEVSDKIANELLMCAETSAMLDLKMQDIRKYIGK